MTPSPMEIIESGSVVISRISTLVIKCAAPSMASGRGFPAGRDDDLSGIQNSAVDIDLIASREFRGASHQLDTATLEAADKSRRSAFDEGPLPGH